MKTIKRNETRLAKEIEVLKEFIEFVKPFAKYKRLTELQNYMQPQRNDFKQHICIPIVTDFYFFVSGSRIYITKYGKIIGEHESTHENKKGEKVTLKFMDREQEKLVICCSSFINTPKDIIYACERSIDLKTKSLEDLCLYVSEYQTNAFFAAFEHEIFDFSESQGGILEGDLDKYKTEYVKHLHKVINKIEGYKLGK